MNARFEIRSVWSTKQENQPKRLVFCFSLREDSRPSNPHLSPPNLDNDSQILIFKPINRNCSN